MVIDKNYVDNVRRNEENTREIIRLKINDDIFHSYRVTVASGLMIILTFSTSLTLLAAMGGGEGDSTQNTPNFN